MRSAHYRITSNEQALHALVLREQKRLQAEYVFPANSTVLSCQAIHFKATGRLQLDGHITALSSWRVFVVAAVQNDDSSIQGDMNKQGCKQTLHCTAI